MARESTCTPSSRRKQLFKAYISHPYAGGRCGIGGGPPRASAATSSVSTASTTASVAVNLTTLAVRRLRGPLARRSVSCFRAPSPVGGAGAARGMEGGARGAPPMPSMGMPPPNLAKRARMPPEALGDVGSASTAASCMRANRSWMDPPGVLGVVGSELWDGVRRCVGMGGGPVEPVDPEDAVRRCVGMGGGPPLPVRLWVGMGGGEPVEDVKEIRSGMGGGGALGGERVTGGGAGWANFAMRAAMLEALRDRGVAPFSFSFFAASSLAFARAIISATPMVRRRRGAWGLR